MHPVLFKLPFIDWPVRLFGLYVIDAFFIATLWAQWHWCRKADPAFAADEGIRKWFRNMLVGIVAYRVLVLAIPGLGWSFRVLSVLAVDFVLSAIVWMKMTDAFRRHETARKEGDFVFNLGFWLLLIGFLGARIFWIVTTPSGRERFVDKPLEALFAVWDGGIVYYGGLLCAAGFGLWYLWWKDRRILEACDILVLGVALAIFIGRWSCLAAGDDYGRPAGDLAWGVVFPDVEATQIPFEYRGKVPLHPSQIYMSLNGLMLFLLLLPVFLRKRFDGQVFFLFLMLYPIGRSIVEMYRGDEGRGLYDLLGFKLSSSQLISIPVFVISGILFLRGYLRSRGKAPESPASAEASGE